MSLPMDSSMLRGGVLVETLLASGVHDVVLAPGSRSAPIALALAAAEGRGRLRLHVRVDERSAGFLALGLAKGAGRPVAVVTTSGTAAVNLHPAIVESSYGGVPLIAVTADRPTRLRGVGANQTIVQPGLFGGECRFACDLTDADAVADVSAVEAAVAMATDPTHPGPVHINLALDEPLLDERAVEEQLADIVRSASTPSATSSATKAQSAGPSIPLPESATSPHGVIIIGDTAGFPREAADPQTIEELSRLTGWPVMSEPSGCASHLSGELRHGPLVAADASFLADHRPSVVLTIGRVGLHRSLMSLIREADHHIVVDPRPEGYRCDPLSTAESFLPVLPTVRDGDITRDPRWRTAWEDADRAWAQHVEEAFEESGELDGARIAREVVATLRDDDLLVVGPSWPVRHVSAFAGAIRARVFANRGTSGIDGVISTAWGIASVSSGFTLCLIGDLTAIYDRNGLLAAPGEAHPHLVYVVIDNDGGGIFGELEQGAPRFAVDFERVFGTPHGSDLGALLAAPGISIRRVESVEQLSDELDDARSSEGVRVVVVAAVERRAQVERIGRMSRREVEND